MRHAEERHANTRRRREHARASVLAALVTATALGVPAASGAEDERLDCEIVLHMPTGHAVADAWIAQQVDMANLEYGPAGVHFLVTRTVPLAATDAHMVTAEDYARTFSQSGREAIDLFLMDEIHTAEGRDLSGVGYSPDPVLAGFVALVSWAEPIALAHELGHYFGLQHTQTETNLMWPEGGGAQLLPSQIAAVRSRSRRLGCHE